MRLAHTFSLMSAAALTAGTLALAPAPASAQGFAMGAMPQPAVAAASGGIVEQVQWRRGGWGGGPGWGGGWRGPGWGGPGWGAPGWGPRYYGGWGTRYGVAPAYYPGWGPYYGGYGYGLGYGYGPAVATGVIIGSAMAAAPQTVYVAPPQNGNWYAYCARKYRSFDPRSGTFLGYDGRRHPCT